jgi:hypothetical protein
VDQGSFAFLNERLQRRLRGVEDRLAVIPKGRGDLFLQLARELLAGAETKRQDVLDQFPGASEAEKAVLVRTLLRLLGEIDVFDLLSPYFSGVGRRDLPVGLTQLIDQLIVTLLPDGADPVIHLDERYMYSTLDLVRLLSDTLASLSVSYSGSPAPVAFSLPSNDPTNAFLTPILAHEVGHVAIDQASLGSEVLDRTDQTILNELFEDCLQAASQGDPLPWQIQFVRWIDELLCDALATALTGPSYLFASAAFLPAPELGDVGTHPFPADRIRLTLDQLDQLGWSPLLEEKTPKVLDWLRNIQQAADPTDHHERFLRGAVDIVAPAIFEVAKKHVGAPLDASEAGRLLPSLMEHFDVGVPPVQLDEGPISSWLILLAAWIHQFHRHGDQSTTVAKAVDDSELSDFLVKALEMARITEIWTPR